MRTTSTPLAVLLMVLTGCATNEPARVPIEAPVTMPEPNVSTRPANKTPPVKPLQPDATTRAPVKPPVRIVHSVHGRALLEHLIPTGVEDHAGWTTDILAALSALDIPQTPENFCSVIAITEQESSFRADPSVPGLPQI